MTLPCTINSSSVRGVISRAQRIFTGLQSTRNIQFTPVQDQKSRVLDNAFLFQVVCELIERGAGPDCISQIRRPGGAARNARKLL